jgi:ADP-ribose pyrophosphatase
MSEERIGSRRIYEGRVVSLRIDTVRIDNKTIAREVVEHPGASAIVPLTTDGRVILVNQYRHAAGIELLEIPAGTIMPGESPEECAMRELQEETGYAALSLELLASIYPSPGYSNEVIHIYIARVGSYVGQNTEPDENIKVICLPLDDAVKMIKERKIKDAKTIAGLILTYVLSR